MLATSPATRESSSPAPRLGTVSIDMDSNRHHLLGYGLAAGSVDEDRLYQLSVERWLELFEELQISATFFAVGQEVQKREALFRTISDAGHEVASHSMSHRQPFGSIPVEELQKELRKSADAITAATGQPVVGFRAPNFELSTQLVDQLVEAGYRYDASQFSGLMVAARQLVCKLRGGNLTARGGEVGGSRRPHRFPQGLMEFPLATMPLLGFPFYSTILFMTGPTLFRWAYTLAHRGMPFFSFVCHGIDMLGLEDGVDPRLTVHPGVARNPVDKRDHLLKFLTRASNHYHLSSFANHMNQLEPTP